MYEIGNRKIDTSILTSFSEILETDMTFENIQIDDFHTN